MEKIMTPFRKAFFGLGTAGLLVAALSLVAAEPGDKFATPSGTQKVKTAEAGTAERGMNLLSWDDGTFENGLGPTGGHYDGQFAMRFGGAAATSGLVPFRIQGAYVGLRSGNPGITAANVNFWHPLQTNGFPVGGAPLTQVAAGVTTGVVQTITFVGPTISTPNGSVLVGLGGLGTTSWFIERDSTGPDNDRDFAGSSANNSLALSIGPGTLGTLGFSGNYLIRLLVDGNVPVELERFSID